MRTLVRNIRTGEYLQRLDAWTTTPEEAFDFGSMAQAFEGVLRLGLRDMELVLIDGPGEVSFVPLAKVDMEHYLGTSGSRPRLRGEEPLIGIGRWEVVRSVSGI